MTNVIKARTNGITLVDSEHTFIFHTTAEVRKKHYLDTIHWLRWAIEANNNSDDKAEYEACACVLDLLSEVISA